MLKKDSTVYSTSRASAIAETDCFWRRRANPGDARRTPCANLGCLSAIAFRKLTMLVRGRLVALLDV